MGQFIRLFFSETDICALTYFVFVAYASSEALDEPVHLRSNKKAFAARTEKRSDVDEGLGTTLFLLRRWFCCC